MRSFHSLLGATGLLLSAALLSLAAQGATPVAAETVANPSVPTALDLQLAQAGPTVPASVPGGEALLFDNGPFVTNPGAGFGGADASAVQTALGVSGYGFGHAISSGFRVADDFTVPAGGWTINAITFFAYQTGSTTTTTINNINLRIWDGVPGAPGSNIVFGDTTTNRLASSSFTNAYRVADSNMLGDTRPIMANTVTVGTNLGAGTYWLDWQSGGTLSSGPWAIPVTIVGATGKPGANGMQFDGSAWGPLVDTGSGAAQDLAFLLDDALPPPPPARCPVGSSEVTLLTQDFEGSFPPPGWSLSNTSACAGVPDWTNTDPGSRGNLTGGTGLFAIADSDSCGSGAMNSQMSSPAFDLTGLTDPQVAFNTDYNDISSASDIADLDFSIDGGGTWTNLFSWNEDHRGPLLVEQPFAADNQAITVLRWSYTNATWDWWWQVDNVEVTACQAMGGTPNSDIGPLSMTASQAANVTSSQTLVIGNTGTADLHWTIDEEPSGTCAAPASVPWLSFTPASGTTAAAGSSNVTIGFDSTGLTAGTYNANLCIFSDDPDPGPGNGTDRVVVPVALSVLAAPPRLVPAFGPIGGTLLGLLLAGFGLVLLRRYQR